MLSQIQIASQTLVIDDSHAGEPSSIVRLSKIAARISLILHPSENAASHVHRKDQDRASAIDRLLNRIEVIMETSFIPATYAISELATAASIFDLLFIKLDPF